MTKEFKRGFVDMLQKIAQQQPARQPQPPAPAVAQKRVARRPADTSSATPPSAGVGTKADNSWYRDVTPSNSGTLGMPAENTYFGQLARNSEEYNPGALMSGSVVRREADPTISALWNANPYGDQTGLYSELYPGLGATRPDGQISQPELAAHRQLQADENAGSLFNINTPEYEALRRNLVQAGADNQADFKTTGEVLPREKADMRGLQGIRFTPEQLEQLKHMQDTMASNGGQQYGSLA